MGSRNLNPWKNDPTQFPKPHINKKICVVGGIFLPFFLSVPVMPLGGGSLGAQTTRSGRRQSYWESIAPNPSALRSVENHARRRLLLVEKPVWAWCHHAAHANHARRVLLRRGV